ncbi:MAG: acetate--CoA ligase family protein [Thermoplasmata archaeon]|nr:acetate--CoA ligase family protein [Thermoplasmata archaeon]
MSPAPLEKISKYIDIALKEGKSVLTLEESRMIMELSGIPFNKCGLATTEKEAVKIAKDIGFPIVMKIVSPQVIHKTEAGGVMVGIDSDAEVKKGWKEIINNVKEKVPAAEIKGILLEEMIKGTELIVGTTVDPQFGHMIMFGIGGIYVEVYKDVSFRLIPITAGDAKDMLSDIKGKSLLEGVRGLPGVEPEQLINVLMSVSELVHKYPAIEEMDINPLIITERGLVAVDARVMLKDPELAKSKKKGARMKREEIGDISLRS